MVTENEKGNKSTEEPAQQPEPEAPAPVPEAPKAEEPKQDDNKQVVWVTCSFCY